MSENMKEIDVENIQLIQQLLKNLLLEFHKICQENGLVYNIYGGTFLGAVRHKDMIPWDDDIDVSMPRADYERFVKIVNEKYSDRFEVYGYPRKNYIYAFSKFCDKNTKLIENNMNDNLGIFALYVDIFPIDGFPPLDSESVKKRFDYMRWLKNEKCKTVYKIIPSKTIWKKPFALVKYIKSISARFHGFEYYLKKEVEESRKYAFEDCDYVSCAVSWHEKGKTLKTDYFDRTLYQIGDHEYWGMKKYDKYLTQMYGDYMTMPPVEQRVSNHDYKLFYIGEEK